MPSQDAPCPLVSECAVRQSESRKILFSLRIMAECRLHNPCHPVLCRWLGVEVAVKELHGTNSVQSNAEMFGEAETLNSLRHPCIIAFYGVVVNQASKTHSLSSSRLPHGQ